MTEKEMAKLLEIFDKRGRVSRLPVGMKLLLRIIKRQDKRIKRLEEKAKYKMKILGKSLCVGYKA